MRQLNLALPLSQAMPIPRAMPTMLNALFKGATATHPCKISETTQNEAFDRSSKYETRSASNRQLMRISSAYATHT
jgi:hypothetical protein